jgi:hypothetical protein
MDDDERAMQLYTLEYQKAAERYENIYRSIWTIFSYLAVLAAGFLTFGASRIDKHASIFIAMSPLLFWFWTTYLPLDRYGNRALGRLAELEPFLNSRFKTALKHFTQAAHPPLSLVAGIVRAVFNPDPYSPNPLQPGWPRIFTKLWAHWERAPKSCHRAFATLRALWHQFRRARFANWVLFIGLHLLVVYEGYAFYKSGQPLFLAKPAGATAVGCSL